MIEKMLKSVALTLIHTHTCIHAYAYGLKSELNERRGNDIQPETARQTIGRCTNVYVCVCACVGKATNTDVALLAFLFSDCGRGRGCSGW